MVAARFSLVYSSRIGYHRTALLIWPPVHDFDVCIENAGIYARERLCTSNSQQPTTDEHKVVKRLIKWSAENQSLKSDQSSMQGTVLASLCEAALRWKNPRLWTKACVAAGAYFNLKIISTQVILRDVQIFGLESFKEL